MTIEDVDNKFHGIMSRGEFEGDTNGAKVAYQVQENSGLGEGWDD